MSQLNLWVDKVFKFLASLKLAIFVIISIAVISAVGTIIESRYNASYAQKVVYHSPYMYFVLALLCVNLLNVIIDRYPWKRHHLGFILAHVGIITLIIGSLMTKYLGVDGSLAIEQQQSARYVSLTETEFVAYGSFGEGAYKEMHRQPVDFLMSRPDPLKFSFLLGEKPLTIKKYYPFALRDSKVAASENPDAGPGLRVQLQNANVNMTQWLLRRNSQPYELHELGPATLVLASSSASYKYVSGNVLVLKVKDESHIDYEIYTRSKGGMTKKGRAKIGDSIVTGWMGLEVRLLKYFPKSDYKTEYIPRDRPTEMTTEAVLIDYNGRESWLGLNSNLQLFSEGVLFLVSFRNKLLDLGFDLHLDKFEVGRYQGTNRAMSYQSLVTVPGLGQNLISMNEPLKYKGFTFYQASFQEDPNTGRPTASILSVNKDPGRFVKYLGSLMIVLGTIVMFYFKHYRLKISQTLQNTGG